MTNDDGKLREHHFRVLAAGFIGNILEWYDFAVYGFFAPTIGKLFFPSDDPATSLIASFGAFAAGFLMRPVGALLFGHIGDVLGRQQALTLSVLLMALPTFLVGLLPTHAQMGMAAAGLMVVLRMIQGVSVGGEFTGSIVFLVEHAPPTRRGLFGSCSMIGSNMGILLGSGVGALLTSVLTDAQLESWGWRLPFLSGVVIGLVGFVVRHGIPELPVSKEQGGSPLFEAVTKHRTPLLQAAGLNLMSAVMFYTVFIYLATWLVDEVGKTRSSALEINTLSMLFLGFVVPVVAALSDRFGRKPFLLAGSLGTVVGAYACLWMMHHTHRAVILCGQFGFALLLGIYVGVIPATIAELFPLRVRVSASSLSYNLPYAIFGGTAPMVAAWLFKETGSAMIVAWYVAFIAGISFLVVLTVRETRGVRLDE